MMFVSVVFTFQYFVVNIWLRVIAGASPSRSPPGVYIANDIRDVEGDPKHPRKKHPTDSGHVSIVVATEVSLPGLVAGPVTGRFIDPDLGLVLGVYVLQNALYSGG